MKKSLSRHRKFLIILIVPFLFLVAYMLGKHEPEPETVEKETVKDYTIEQPADNPAASMPKKEDITVPNQHDKLEAQKTATAFVMAFHAVDGKNPYQYLEDAKPYMTDEAFKRYNGIPKRGTLAAQKVEPTGTDLLPIELSDSVQLWRVGVTSLQGEEYIFTEYQVKLIKDGQTWKVDGVKVND